MRYSLTLVAMCLAGTAQAETINADVWADNWFALYVNETLVKEDSVPITTERSFNKESFSFDVDRPFVLNFIAKDFKENDSGLEYIGTRRQQMGDGGLIAQFISADETIAVTNSDWSCLVIHDAPIDKSCEGSDDPIAGQGACGFSELAEPAGWKAIDFDDRMWPAAVEHSERAVSPKDGYDQVDWARNSKLIWGEDLETNNTLLCRLVVR